MLYSTRLPWSAARSIERRLATAARAGFDAAASAAAVVGLSPRMAAGSRVDAGAAGRAAAAVAADAGCEAGAAAAVGGAGGVAAGAGSTTPLALAFGRAGFLP